MDQVPAGEFNTATATAPGGDTSAFSNGAPVAAQADPLLAAGTAPQGEPALAAGPAAPVTTAPPVPGAEAWPVADAAGVDQYFAYLSGAGAALAGTLAAVPGQPASDNPWLEALPDAGWGLESPSATARSL